MRKDIRRKIVASKRLWAEADKKRRKAVRANTQSHVALERAVAGRHETCLWLREQGWDDEKIAHALNIPEQIVRCIIGLRDTRTPNA